MEPHTLEDGAPAVEVHHRKPKHLAEKLESYVGMITVAVGGVLFVLVLYAITQTGNATPSWMH